ncbi:MAG TPA: MFS transporter [Geminicoccaceae bacterium]|nr:MFS transporter [Geminicoccaceae bacterium]
MTRLGAIPRTLAHRNFGIYIAGSSVSLIGNWMQRIGVGWLAWELSHSGAILGLVAFADLFPTIAIGPFGGALADRFDRLRMLRITQTAIMLQAFTLFLLTATGLITVELLLGLVLLGGIVVGFNQPARLALAPSLVPRSDLATAVAINSIVFNLARFVGPALAGLVIVWWGIGMVFALNALSFLAFLFALAHLRLPPLEIAGHERRSMLSAIGEGLRYTTRHAGIGPLLLLHAVLAVSARPFFELLPGFASDVFGRGASGLAMLGSAVGIGAVAGGLWLAQRHEEARLTNVALGSSFLVTLSVMIFSMGGPFAVALAAVALAGCGMVVAGIATQTLLQTSVEEAMRGRVLSLFGLIFRGGPAVGALMMGAASEVVGLQAPVAAGTVIGLIASLLIWRHRGAIAQNLGERPLSSPA